MDSKLMGPVMAGNGITIPPQIMESMMLTRNRLKEMGKEEFISELLYGPSTYLLKKDGKLIRPGLLFSSAVVLGQEPKEFVNLATGIELLHTASLIHDDILDKDSRRRGGDAVHVKYGTGTAILAGDALIAKAIQLASDYGGRVVTRASEAAMAMCAGEVLDNEQQELRTQVDLVSYLRIAQLKTASLIAVSCSVVADCINHESRDSLYELGLNIGLSFQLKDDIMNYFGITDTADKSVKTDAKNGRPNIVSVFNAHGREEPLKTAIKLNNYYLDKSAVILDTLDNSEIFRPYLDFLRIST